MTTPPLDENPVARTNLSPTALRWAGRIRWLVVLLSLGAACFAWAAYWSPSSSDGASSRYLCPMHPQVMSSDPGECPICHMALEPVRDPAPPAPKSAAGTALSARAPAVSASAPSPNPASSWNPARAGPPLASVDIGFDRAQAIGVRTAVAERAPSASVLRVTASVSATEASSAEVRARAAGFIEKVQVGERGGRVKKGQALVLLYSPEIYQAFSDYVLASQWAKADPESGRARDATRQRLELLGVPRSAIDRAESTGEVPRTLALTAPISGYVVEKNINLGSYVSPELVLYRIVNLDRVFVVADLPSADLLRVRPGQKAKFSPAARPDLDLETEVDLVVPKVGEASRTFEVRLRLENQKVGLLPGEFGTLELSVPQREAVWVPRDAIVDTGLDRYVFVEIGPGKYQPRQVEVGESNELRVEIQSGVSAGERLVSGATFLIDSESRLRAALSTGAPEAGGVPALQAP